MFASVLLFFKRKGNKKTKGKQADLLGRRKKKMGVGAQVVVGRGRKGRRQGDLPIETRFTPPETVRRAKSKENLQYPLTQRTRSRCRTEPERALHKIPQSSNILSFPRGTSRPRGSGRAVKGGQRKPDGREGAGCQGKGGQGSPKKGSI